MDPKQNILSLLDAVEKTLSSTVFRNSYEAENAHASNSERLLSAEQLLRQLQLPGSEIDLLDRRIAKLKVSNDSRSTRSANERKTTTAEDWVKQLEMEAIGDDEEEILTLKKKEKSEKKEKKEKKPKEQRVLESLPSAPHPRGPSDVSTTIEYSHKERKVLEVFPNCGFEALPQKALSGKSFVVQLPNSPCVEVYFESECTTSTGERSRCVAVMYRVVVAALWRGIPISHHTDAAAVSSAPLISEAEPKDMKSNNNKGDTKESIEEEEEEEGSAEEGEEDLEEGANAEHAIDDTVREYSERLVQEYAEAETEDEAESFARGRDAPSQIVIPVPHFKEAYKAPWTVLMCHGGYFAGGVFANGKAIVHKAFQRYVVRKKQGGMQSKADKTGGVMKSAGSQIRRHNELKWRVMVRDTLLQWKVHIDKSWIILFVAPGPDNRAVLTDFTAIPASFGGGSAKGAARSPIDPKDLRVRSAPLTTHRPTFAEVQRIYNEVSRVTVRHEEY